MKRDIHKLRTFFSDVAKLAGHAASKDGRTGPGSRVILQSTKIKLY